MDPSLVTPALRPKNHARRVTILVPRGYRSCPSVFFDPGAGEGAGAMFIFRLRNNSFARKSARPLHFSAEAASTPSGRARARAHIHLVNFPFIALSAQIGITPHGRFAPVASTHDKPDRRPGPTERIYSADSNIPPCRGRSSDAKTVMVGPITGPWPLARRRPHRGARMATCPIVTVIGGKSAGPIRQLVHIHHPGRAAIDPPRGHWAITVTPPLGKSLGGQRGTLPAGPARCPLSGPVPVPNLFADIKHGRFRHARLRR